MLLLAAAFAVFVLGMFFYLKTAKAEDVKLSVHVWALAYWFTASLVIGIIAHAAQQFFDPAVVIVVTVVDTAMGFIIGHAIVESFRGRRKRGRGTEKLRLLSELWDSDPPA